MLNLPRTGKKTRGPRSETQRNRNSEEVVRCSNSCSVSGVADPVAPSRSVSKGCVAGEACEPAHTASGQKPKNTFPCSSAETSLCLHPRQESLYKCHLPGDLRDCSNPRSRGNVCRRAERRAPAIGLNTVFSACAILVTERDAAAGRNSVQRPPKDGPEHNRAIAIPGPSPGKESRPQSTCTASLATSTVLVCASAKNPASGGYRGTKTGKLTPSMLLTCCAAENGKCAHPESRLSVRAKGDETPTGGPSRRDCEIIGEGKMNSVRRKQGCAYRPSYMTREKTRQRAARRRPQDRSSLLPTRDTLRQSSLRR